MGNATARYVESCPVGCAAPLIASDCVLPEGALLRCAECGQLISQITATAYRESMGRFNETDYNQPVGRALERRHAVAKRRLARIAALLDRPPARIRLVDVGCSRGQFVEAAVNLGFDAEGVEPAPAIAEAARERGLKIHTGLLEEQRFPDSAAAAVTLFEVIEHLRDPASLLRECRRILEPGGVLLLSTGNAASWTARAMKGRWDYFNIACDAGHISFFNPCSLERLAARCGYAVERIETARVKFHDKGEVSRPAYLTGKLAAELLNVPARLAGAGHDMLGWLRRPREGDAPGALRDTR